MTTPAINNLRGHLQRLFSRHEGERGELVAAVRALSRPERIELAAVLAGVDGGALRALLPPGAPDGARAAPHAIVLGPGETSFRVHRTVKVYVGGELKEEKLIAWDVDLNNQHKEGAP